MSFDELKAEGLAAERRYYEARVAEHEARGRDLAAAYDRIAELDRLVAELSMPPVPPRRVPVGVALNDQSARTFESWRSAHPWTAGQRIFHTPGDLPASWERSKAGHLSSGRHMVSFKPDIRAMAAESGPAIWASRFAETAPVGTYFVCQHEPENKSKNISPAMFTAATNGLMGGMDPHGVTRTIVLMEYQFKIQGDAYMRGIHPEALDAVGADFYAGKGDGRTVRELCEPFFDAARRLFPGVELVIGELGVSPQAPKWGARRGEWLRDGLEWLDSQEDVGAVFYYQTTIGNEADWALTDAEWAVAMEGRG